MSFELVYGILSWLRRQEVQKIDAIVFISIITGKT